MEYERHSLKNSLSTTPTLLLYRVPHSYSSCLFNLLNLMYYIYSCIIYNLIYYTPLYYILEWFNFLLKSQFLPLRSHRLHLAKALAQIAINWLCVFGSVRPASVHPAPLSLSLSSCIPSSLLSYVGACVLIVDCKLHLKIDAPRRLS